MERHGEPVHADATRAPTRADQVSPDGQAAAILRLIDGMRLPKAISLECEGTLADGRVYDRMTISSGPDWLYSVQSLQQGSLGFIATNVRHSTLDRSTVYHTDRRTGHIDNRLGEHGGVEEDVFSPQFAARSVRWALAHDPQRVSMASADGNLVAVRREFADCAPRTMIIDPVSGECREMRIGEQPSPVVRVQFNEWRPIDGATSMRHPASAKMSEMRGDVEIAGKTLVYSKVKALPASATAPVLELPPTARLEVKETGDLVDPSGKVMGHLAQAAKPASYWPFSMASTFTAGAVLVLMVAITLWRRRG